MCTLQPKSVKFQADLCYICSEPTLWYIKLGPFTHVWYFEKYMGQKTSEHLVFQAYILSSHKKPGVTAQLLLIIKI